MTFYFQHPKTHYGTGRNAHKLKPKHDTPWHTANPDIDNCEKGILDILTGIGFWRDDSIVVVSQTSKRYADGHVPGASISIESLYKEPTP